MWVDDFWYFTGNILLPVVLLGNYFLQTIGAVLFSHVGHSFLQLKTFLLEFKRVEGGYWRWGWLYNCLFGLLFFGFLFFGWSFVPGLFLGLFLLGLLFSSGLVRFGLFLHGIFLETLDDSLLCHEGRNFILKIWLSGIGQWVHSLNTSLLKPKATI